MEFAKDSRKIRQRKQIIREEWLFADKGIYLDHSPHILQIYIVRVYSSIHNRLHMICPAVLALWKFEVISNLGPSRDPYMHARVLFAIYIYIRYCFHQKSCWMPSSCHTIIAISL